MLGLDEQRMGACVGKSYMYNLEASVAGYIRIVLPVRCEKH